MANATYRNGDSSSAFKGHKESIASSQPDSRERLGLRVGMGVAPGKETPGQVRVERRSWARKPSEPSYQALVATLESGEDRRADLGVYTPALHSEEAMLRCTVAAPCWGRNSEGGSCSLSFSQGLLVPLKTVQTGTQDLAAGCLATWLSTLVLPHTCVHIHIQPHAHIHMFTCKHALTYMCTLAGTHRQLLHSQQVQPLPPGLCPLRALLSSVLQSPCPT